MRTSVAFAFATALALAGCGGGGAAGGSSSTLPNTGGGNGAGSQASQARVQSENSINAANALGAPLKSIQEMSSDLSGAQTAALNRSGALAVHPLSSSGTCTNGYEFFAPDRNGDASSTEVIYFYDNACTQPAHDAVRLYTINGTSESVKRTVSDYAIGNATPISTLTSTVNIVNGTYDTNGYPITADGFARSATSSLVLGGSKTITEGDEMVVAPTTTNISAFCSDTAGYNATGIASLGETFGWQGGVPNGGTITNNGSGSVTWTSTHAGSTYKGAIGSLSLGTATANTTCPVVAPEYSLVGGTEKGSYSIPVTATYQGAELSSLTVTNATLASGYTLNVLTNTSDQPVNADFITGTVSSGTTQISTFNADAFGDGTLTITASGAQYVINDWHVVK